MSNITMSLDDDLIKKVRKIAIEKNTSLTGMVRDYLTTVAEKEEIKKENVVRELQAVYRKSKAEIGEKKWNREDLHER